MCSVVAFEGKHCSRYFTAHGIRWYEFYAAFGQTECYICVPADRRPPRTLSEALAAHKEWVDRNTKQTPSAKLGS
jgi:hypothetical protein